MLKKILSSKNIILFGGTFDPIHLGHLILAQEAQNFLSAEKVFFIPCFRSPFKLHQEISDFKHRLAMLNLSIKGNPSFVISDYEIKKKNVSYTCDTVEYFSKKYKGYKIYLLIGLDSLLEFKLWKNWKDILKKVTLVVGQRDVKGKLSSKFIKDNNIIFLSSPKIEISSTEIKKRVKSNKPIKYLVVQEVEKYIIKNKLYL